MAYNLASPIFLISLLIFSAVNPPAHGAVINLRGLSVTGRLCCTSNGNCPGQGVSGANVTLNCNILGVSAVIGQGTTNVNGTFNITVPAVTGLILGLRVVPCVATVRLPLDAAVCPVLSTVNGVLTSAIQSVGTLLTATLGLVQNATLVGFINLRL